MGCTYLEAFVACIVSVWLGVYASAGDRLNVTSATLVHGQRPVGGSRGDQDFEIVPDRVLQHINRGSQLSNLQRYDEGIEEYRAALKEAGRPVFTAYLNMGSVYFNKQDYSTAVEMFKQALALKPNSWQAHYNLGEALFANADYAGAEREYRRVLELPPSVVKLRARHFLGLALYKQGRIDDAIVEYRAAIQQAAGNYSEAHYNLGIALLERDRPEAAEQEFRLAIEQEKKAWPEAQYNFAKALERQKRFREAADAYELYVKMIPDASDAKRIREYIDYLRRKK